MDILQNVNITATAYIQAHCIRKPNSRTFCDKIKKLSRTLSLFKVFKIWKKIQ